MKFSTISKGSDNKSDVKTVQLYLSKILNTHVTVDGDFGPQTEKAVKKFQERYLLPVNGVVDEQTWTKMTHLYLTTYKFNAPMQRFSEQLKFMVCVDAGHGGIDDKGRYVTPGKRMKHANIEAHQDGWYYEGYENRIVAERFIEMLSQNNILYDRTYHPYQDTPLRERAERVRSWLRRGYVVFLISFHSNAISLEHPKSKLDRTRGFGVYTTTANNLSDEVAEIHYSHIKNEFPEWRMRPDNDDGDSDREANFTILAYTDMHEFDKSIASVLEEFGFHTSEPDTEFIMSNREKRAKCALKTAMWVKARFEQSLGYVL